MSNVTHLECALCGRQYEPGRVYNLCICGAPLLVRYDLRRAAETMVRERMSSRPPTLWRYREVLPVTNDVSILCLGEGFTPLIHAQRLGNRLGLPNLYLKDEALNPTGSFKARGLAVAVSMANELGLRKLAIPSAGNAGGALAAYAAHGGLEAAVFMPAETPLMNRRECALLGARVVLVSGSIKDCARAMRDQLKDGDWFDVSTLREPYRLEGKKTMAYEVVEQLERRVPQAMIYPTGGGTGLIGMWKAFDEMEELGWIGSVRPRMFSVQAQGCAPIVRAFAQGRDRAAEWEAPQTLASGLRVPSAIGDFMMLRAIRESRGSALAVPDSEMLAAMRELAEFEGVLTSPEGGATLAALKKLLADGFLAGHESIVLFLTASAYKYQEVFEKLTT
ncbi:MAG: threonine synthase [Terriglobia bacterium]|jgi:threonine synthase